MGKVLRNRLAQIVPVALISTILIFLIIHIAPGNPAQILAGPDATPTVVKAVRARLGLNGPLYQQYLSWLEGVIHGKLGVSYISSESVSSLLGSRIIATSELIFSAGLIAVVVGVALGSFAGYRSGTRFDSMVSWLTGIMVSIPEFWVGLLLILLVSVKLGWLPAEGTVSFTTSPLAALGSLILPAFTLAIQPTALIARSVQASVAVTLKEDYVRTARIKGVVGMRLYFRHIFKNALMPILSIVGVVLTRMLGGAIVIESVFAWPGLGLLLVTSISNRDYQVVQASLLVFILAVIVVNLLTDLAYALVDPRIRSKVSGA